MAQKASAQVAEIIRKNKAAMTMVVQDATQSLVNAASVPKAKGGKMPVDTGFLRASRRISLSGVPSGPVRPPKDGHKGGSEPPDAAATLSKFKPGMSIYVGWTAIYARRQELYNGFLSSNLRKWQKFVDDAVRKFRDSIR